MFSMISRDVRQCKIRITQTHNLESQLQQLDALKQAWKAVPALVPEEIDISRLHLLQQIQDSTAVVKLSNANGNDEILVFKTLSDSIEYLYHELEVLVSIPPHPNIIGCPRHIVTKNCSFGAKAAVVGFTLPYHKQGSLRDILLFRRIHETLNLKTQLKWAIQIVEAVQHVQKHGPGYYCDLRLDNILISDTDDVVLIDFEQRGVMPAFASPLDKYLQYICALASDSSLEASVWDEVQVLYNKYINPHLSNEQQNGD